MIYFDNAATTKKKPQQVLDAFNYYVTEIGVSPGRGSYSLGIEASRMLFQTRKKVGHYFGLEKEQSVVFTKNSTEAINLFFDGFLKEGSHVVTTCYEHNAVLRPLHALKEAGRIQYSVINRNDLYLAPEDIYEKYCRDNTAVFAVTLASNLTGRIVFRKDVMQYMQSKGIVTFVDASQGAGKIRLSMKNEGIDYLAFTGHKDLMALPGVGGLCCKNKVSIKPLIQGGTGIFGDSYMNPDTFPEGLEAGTLNMPAIWSLNAAIDYLTDNFSDKNEYENDLKNYLLDGLSCLNKVIVYDYNCERVPTVGINYKGYASDILVQALDRAGICVRGGIHCAILAHEALGTVNKGVVRVSLSMFNDKSEIDALISVLNRIGE